MTSSFALCFSQKQFHIGHSRDRVGGSGGSVDLRDLMGRNHGQQMEKTLKMKKDSGFWTFHVNNSTTWLLFRTRGLYKN